MAVQQYLMMGKSGTDRNVISGERWVWGLNTSGIGGLGNTTNISSPVQVGSLTDWQNTEIPNGSNGGDRGDFSATHVASVKSDGTLWTWGVNSVGQLGHGNTTFYSSPVQVGSLTDWKEASVGQAMTVAVKTDGTLWTCGSGGYGKLGHNNETSISSPAQVGSDTDWVHVIPRNTEQTVVMKSDGSIYVTGRIDMIGETNVSTMTQIGSETGFVDAVAMGNHIVLWKEA
jgi:alpha-tubulin suppressor-like RCC1 family protein